MAAALNVCEGCEIDKMLESFCVNCEQLYCQECTTYHMKCKTTRSHILLDASHRDTDINHSSIEVKCGNECGEQVVSLCLDCRQLLCIDCFNKHSMLKATKEHNAITAKHLTDSHPRVIESRPSVVSHPQQLVRAQVQVEKGQYSGTFTNKFKCSAPGDKEVARVRGIAILSDGRIVVADYKNRSLKLFNSELRFETVKYIKEDPLGIATSANDFVVVTIADKKEIRIYKFEKNKIRTHKTIKVIDKPYSIACDKDHFAVELGEGDDGTIRIYDRNLREMCVIPGNTRSFGQFTSNTLRLALDYTKQVIFVADVVKESVHCVDFHGGLIWTAKVRSPRGIVFNNSILFVASNDLNRIHQMNSIDGSVYALLNEIDGIKRPRYIAYNSNLTKLAVETDSNHIKIYSVIK